MRTIKPGKVAAKEKDSVKKDKDDSPSFKREIWDDFAPVQKVKRKKEFEKGSTGRMVPTPSAKPEQKEEKPAEDFSGEPAYKPREDFEYIEEKFHCKLSDYELLSRALTHRSALGAVERADYERLEFLGDAVLDLSVAHLLSDRHPEAREGELSKMRAALVNTQALAEIGKILGIGPFIKLGRGELSSGGSDRPSILADVMEAIIGAIYRDKGYDKSLEIIEKVFGEALDQVTPFDPKTELQEALHVAGSEPPSYLLELVEGPEHAPTFVTVVLVDNEIAGRGKGPTKKASQQSAAAEALDRLKATATPVSLSEGQSEIIVGALLSNDQGIEPPQED